VSFENVMLQKDPYMFLGILLLQVHFINFNLCVQTFSYYKIEFVNGLSLDEGSMKAFSHLKI
jgi:hypothetical protein